LLEKAANASGVDLDRAMRLQSRLGSFALLTKKPFGGSLLPARAQLHS
jgi:hypothetical protein